MSLKAIRVEGYRSLVNFRLRLGPITVVTGPNGSGKSNLYRAFKLVHHAANGNLARAIADEGGMPSVLWSGKPRATKDRREIKLTIESDPLSYDFVAGLPPQTPGDPSFFTRDPDMKEESIWATDLKRPSTTLMERKGDVVQAVDHEGRRQRLNMLMSSSESVLSQLREPELYPELFNFQFRLSRWRFYHQFRTDADSPIRRPQVGSRTPVLHHDGRDLAAALQTIREAGMDHLLDSVLEDAFPDSEFSIDERDGWFSMELHKADLGRPLEGHEFSDGTLRFLCLVAALLSPDPPELIVLNEPEMSLNGSLLPPLARLIVECSQRSQVWVTTHSDFLLYELEAIGEVRTTRLSMWNGETKIEGKENVVFEADDE